MWFRVNIPSQMRTETSLTSEKVALLTDTALCNQIQISEDATRLNCICRLNGGGIVEGWIKNDPERMVPADAPPRETIDVTLFLRTCVDAEVWINGLPETESHFVLADYLAALSLVETGMTDAPPAGDGSGGLGPFLIDAGSWGEFVAGPGGADFGPADRDDYLNQCYCAAFLTQRDIRLVSEAVSNSGLNETGDTGGESEPFVPSLVDVLLAWVTNGAAAAEFRMLKIKNQGNVRVDEVLLQHAVGANIEERSAWLAALALRRTDFLRRDATSFETTDGMYAKLETRLAKELAAAFKLMKKHIPEDIPQASDSSAWMAIAAAEEAAWQANGLVENSGDGAARVIKYFEATDSGITTVQHWCGAFVAHCLAGSTPPLPAVSGSARAANWKVWGVAVPLGAPDYPRGAVVVLSPAPGSQTSGHVGFFSSFLDGAGNPQVELLGGNQRDTVRLSKFARTKVVAVRMPPLALGVTVPLETGEPPPSKFSSLLEVVSRHEGGKNYNARFGDIANQNPRFVDMTLSEVLRWQADFVRKGSPSSAVGRYQIIQGTLRGLKDKLKLVGTELFDAALQDRLAMQLLKNRKLENFLSKSISRTRFGLFLAMEWASLPVLAAVNGKHKSVVRGQSFYAGDGLNKAHVAPEDVETVLNALI
jgi:uncharacterized protein (TIGR02594 family)